MGTKEKTACLSGANLKKLGDRSLPYRVYPPSDKVRTESCVGWRKIITRSTLHLSFFSTPTLTSLPSPFDPIHI